MKFLKRGVGISLLLCLLFTPFKTALAEDTVDLREKTKAFYYELFRINSTGSLDLANLLSMLDPKVEVIHQGPKSVYAPFYKSYKPIGIVPYSAFMSWVLNMMTAVTITTFVPEYSYDMGTLGVQDYNRYMIVDGNTVYSHVLEGGKILRWNFTNIFSLISADTPWAVDNMHIISFNEKGLIQKLVFISQSEGFMNTVDGIPSYPEDLIDSQAKNIPVDNYDFDPWHAKGIGAMFVGQLTNGTMFETDSILNDAVVCEIPGSAPFSGEFSGIDQVEDFVRLFSEEVIDITIIDMAGEFNKAAIQCRIAGANSSTGQIFISERAVFSFQFDEEGRILSIKLNYDTYAAAEAYK